MLLSTHNNRKGELEQEPHNLFVDFSEDFLCDGSNGSIGDIIIGLPYPIQEPLINSKTNTRDPLKELFNQKEQYSEKFNAAQSKNLINNIENVSFDNGTKYIYMPRGLLELYHLRDSNLNFFSTDGVLDFLNINNNKYLVWVTFNGVLNLMNVDNISESNILPFSASTSINCLRSYNFTEKAQIILLEKYSVTVLEVLNPVNCFVVYQNCFKEAVIEAKLNKNDNSHLGILQSNQMTIRNMKSNKVFFVHKKGEQNPENHNFIQFEFWKKSKLILMDQFFLKVFDYQKQTIIQTFDPKLISCNTLCNLKVLDDKIYLISRHYVIKTDLNNLKKISTFAHTLENSPVFFDLFKSEKNTYLCVANQDEKVLFTRKAIFNLPYKVPNIKATLREALLKNADLALIDELQERLDFTITGLKFIELNSKIYIYFTNSLGEIFRQEISNNYTDTNEPVDSLCKWIRKLNPPKSALFVTNFVEMSDAFFFLNRDKIEKNSQIHNNNTIRFLEKYKNKYSKKYIESTFAKEFLEIWDDFEESEDEDDLPKDDEFEVPYYDKVNSWMEKMDGHLENKDEPASEERF